MSRPDLGDLPTGQLGEVRCEAEARAEARSATLVAARIYLQIGDRGKAAALLTTFPEIDPLEIVGESR